MGRKHVDFGRFFVRFTEQSKGRAGAWGRGEKSFFYGALTHYDSFPAFFNTASVTVALATSLVSTPEAAKT